jgi:hypothetical protein
VRVRAGMGAMFSVIAFTTASCGGHETEHDRVSATVDHLQEDMAAGRYEAVCSAIATRPRRQIGSVGHGRKPTTCVHDLREFVQGTETPSGSRESGLRRTRKPDIVAVRIDPDDHKATVTLSLGRGDPFRIPLVKEHGDWKLNDFFGVEAPPPKALR